MIIDKVKSITSVLDRYPLKLCLNKNLNVNTKHNTVNTGLNNKNVGKMYF